MRTKVRTNTKDLMKKNFGEDIEKPKSFSISDRILRFLGAMMTLYCKFLTGVGIFGATTGAMGGGWMAYQLRSKNAGKLTTAVHVFETSVFGGLIGALMPWAPIGLCVVCGANFTSLAWQYKADRAPSIGERIDLANRQLFIQDINEKRAERNERPLFQQLSGAKRIGVQVVEVD